MGPTERYLSIGLPAGVITAILNALGWSFSDRGIGDDEITAQTQTHPIPDAHTRRSDTTHLGYEHDLAIQLHQDLTTDIPAAEDYRHLKETPPIMVDALHAHGMSGMVLTGGGHFNLGRTLGTALPITRQGGLRVIDLQGNEQTDASHSDDRKTSRAVARSFAEHTPQDSSFQEADRLHRVTVLICNRNDQNQQPFDELKAAHDKSLETVIGGSDNRLYPSSEGTRLAKEIANGLRKRGAGRELHTVWSAAVSLASLIVRRTSTLSCAFYELTQNPPVVRQRYQGVLRVAVGMPHSPIIEAFDKVIPTQ